MTVLKPDSLEFISRSSEQTRRVGMRLGTMLKAGDVIGLVGDLGAGKTTLVQGISAGWGSLDAASSPTFVLVNIYRRLDGQQMYHLDAYRLGDAAEANDLDLDAMLESGPLVVEWAERIQDALPVECLWVILHLVDDEQRDLIISARGERYRALLHDLRQQFYGVG